MVWLAMIMLIGLTLYMLGLHREPDTVTVSLGNQSVNLLRISKFGNCRVGLLNHLSLPDSQGLWFARARPIHTRGMHFPIDVIWLDAEEHILAIEKNVPRNKVVQPVKRAKSVLELAGDFTDRHALTIGEKLRYE